MSPLHTHSDVPVSILPPGRHRPVSSCLLRDAEVRQSWGTFQAGKRGLYLGFRLLSFSGKDGFQMAQSSWQYAAANDHQPVHSWVCMGFLTVPTLYSSDLPAKMIIAINNVCFKNTIKASLSSAKILFPFFRNLGNAHLG